jgi:hypothetical protein
VGELLDYDVQHQLRELVLTIRACHQRSAVEDDPGRMLVCAGLVGRLESRQRHGLCILGVRLRGRDFFDPELHAGQFRLPPGLKLGHREQN